jgi:hypothetical protein
MQFLEELHYAARKVIDSGVEDHIDRLYPQANKRKTK